MYNAYPGKGDWLPGAVEALHHLLSEGYDLMIYSTRLSKYEVDEVTLQPAERASGEYNYVRSMLDGAGLEMVGIWMNDWKPGAKFYIDDKAIPIYPDSGWEGVLELLGV